MEEKKKMSEKIRVMFSEEQVNEKIKELGAQISADMKGEPVKIICILKGASFFACELAKRITVPVFIDFMSVSSYGDGTESSGIVRIIKDLDDSIIGENVLIVEDIIDKLSGRELKEPWSQNRASVHTDEQTIPPCGRCAGRLHRL